MASILDRLSKRSTRLPEENAQLTPSEQSDLEAQLARDEEALRKSEVAVKTLPPGHVLWKCPGCEMTWSGLSGGPQYKSYKSHLDRHAHARQPRVVA